MDRETEKIVAEVKDLTKAYRGLTVLKRVSFQLKAGHVYGFIGNNGAGKTTLMRMLAGLSFPDEGEVSLFGSKTKKEQERNRSRVGFLIEGPVFYPDMSAYQNLMQQAKLKGITEKEHVEELLELVNLQSAGKKAVKDFSTGMKQRYGLAFALIGWPELLVLDEPLNGMDVESMDEVSEVLRRLREEKGITIFLSSHILSRLSTLATDYIFLDHGNVIKEITAEELQSETQSWDLEGYFRKLVSGK